MKGFARHAAQSLLGTDSPHLVKDTPACLTWRFETLHSIRQALGSLFEERSLAVTIATGLSRGIMTGSETVARVLATMIAPFEVSWVRGPSGLHRLFINFDYVLADGHGELHPPKDENRNEIALTPALEAQIRAEIMTDVSRMTEMGYPLAPKWWEQLGDQPMAQQMIARLLALQAQPQPALLAPKAPGKASRHAPTARKTTRAQFSIEAIVDERTDGQGVALQYFFEL